MPHLLLSEEGTISLDDLAGPEGSTVRHLMAHASGLGFEDDASNTFTPGSRRIYSNIGIERLANHLEQSAGIAFLDYLTEAVIQPLGLDGFEAVGKSRARHAGFRAPPAAIRPRTACADLALGRDLGNGYLSGLR